jgi:hypothetical protein
VAILFQRLLLTFVAFRLVGVVAFEVQVAAFGLKSNGKSDYERNFDRGKSRVRFFIEKFHNAKSFDMKITDGKSFDRKNYRWENFWYENCIWKKF